MKRTFRNFKIYRTCTINYEDYHSYKDYLQSDFHFRCAYCNLLDSEITTSYEIDHFIPKDTFKDEWSDLEKTYKNLVYSCKKCNGAKSNQFKGDISKRVIENELFYDPENTDYNTIFYRDDTGCICSDDAKGRDMINRIKLYRPIHNLAWICEITKNTLEKLNKQIEIEGMESPKGILLLKAKNELNDFYNDCRDVFIANYNNGKYIIQKHLNI